MTKNLKSFLVFLIAPILSLITFALLFQIWKLDLHQPVFRHNNDALFYFFLIKNVIDNGWFFYNDFVGAPHFTTKFYLHDFPQHAEFFNFVIIKIFTCFSQNPFLIANSFFILTFALVSASAFAVLRIFNISIFTAVLISILYAFLPYHFARNSWHLFLSNYFLIPLVVMVGIWIMQDKIKTFDFNKKGQFAFAGNRNFFIGLAISCLAATTGIYYAFYSCVIFIFSWFLCGLKKGKFFDKNSFCAVIFCLVILSLLLYLYLPAILYWIDFGHNSDVAKRNVADSEFFALKIINLFVPVANHYFDYLKNIRELFDAFASEQENFATSLGILAASGFLFLLLWLLARNFSEEKSVFAKTIKKFSLQKNHQDLISNLAGLNLLSILFATVGGLVMFVAVAFPLLRSHARFSIFIAFFSLFLVAIIFDRIIEKKIFKQKIFAQIFVLFIFVMALFDQVGRVSAATIQTEKMKRKFRNDQEFVQKIEKSLPEKSQIFVLPVISFPEGSDDYDLLSAYLHSKNLRWSYPSIAGRESNLWQKKIIKLDFKDFVFELKKAGFSGIYIDRMQMTQYALEKEKPKAWHDLRKIESKLKSLKKPVLTSDDLRLVFFEI